MATVHTSPPDTLSCDNARLQEILANSDYDYVSQLNGEGQSHTIWDTIVESFKDWFHDMFSATGDAVGNGLSEPVVRYLVIFALILLIIFVAYKVWKKRMWQSARESDEGIDYDVVEDNIYGVDFDARIAQAVAAGDYREAVRLRYLQSLKCLNDNALITWQPHKTPLQYRQEFDNESLRAMTDVFLPVRYGDYPATQEHYNRVTALYREILKTPVASPAEEGGEQ